MKTYLIITGTIFGLIAIGHVFELLFHWQTLTSDRWFTLGVTLIIIVSGILCIWAWVLLKAAQRAASRSSGAGNTLH